MFKICRFFEFFLNFFLIFLTGLVSKVEKNLSDHTEFINYKKEMDKWLSNANETLAECLGVGDQQSTQIKLSSINVRIHFIFLK